MSGMIKFTKNVSNKEIIYISYDGILEALGQSQVLKYIKSSRYNKKIILLTFENTKNLKHIMLIKNMLSQGGIEWHFYLYKKNLWILSKLFDFMRIIYFLIKKFLFSNIQIIHCRSYFTAYAAYFVRYLFKFNLIFDMRGFWIDERYEWGIWKKNLRVFQFLKKIEKKLIKVSDKIVVLTKDAKKELITKYKKKDNDIFIIPTCADEKQFSISNEKYWKGCINFCHLGSINTRYDLDYTINFFKNINIHVKSKLLFINQSEKNFITSKCKKFNISKSDYEIISVDHFDVQNYLNKFDYIIFFPKKGYYRKGFFPTKIAESLLSGIPIITSDINLHIDELFINYNLGIKINNAIKKDYKKLSSQIIEYKDFIDRNLLRNFAKEKLSLTYASNIYDNIYKELYK